MLHVGQAAIVAKAREMLVVMSRLDRQIAFRPGSELGLMLAQANEWAVVKATPPKWETKVRVGDALAAVDDHATLLKTYEDMFALVVAAKRSKLPYTLTFRRAPFHRGWLYKKPKAGRGKEEGFFSGMTGWKKRYFVLAYGVLACVEIKIFKIRSTSSNPNGFANETYPGFETSTRGDQSFKSQPNRLRFDGAREFSRLVGTPQASG